MDMIALMVFTGTDREIYAFNTEAGHHGRSFKLGFLFRIPYTPAFRVAIFGTAQVINVLCDDQLATMPMLDG